MHHRSLLPVLTLAFASALSAQTWASIGTQSRYRVTHGMASDPLTHRPLVAGGGGVYDWQTPTFHDADSFRWDGNAWHRVSGYAPAALDSLLMATDTARQRIVLVANTESPAETWEWDGTDWTNRATIGAPPTGSVYGAGLAFDSARNRTVLFDGSLRQTWEYDGTQWTQVVTAASPAGRHGFRLAFDPHRGRTVLFGGEDGSRQHNLFTDTWEYTGSNWLQVTTPTAPPGRYEYALAYDPTLQRVLLHAGRVQQTMLTDTWSYDGTTWTAHAPANVPPPQVDPAMVADDTSGHVLLVTDRDTGNGAVPETWEWDGSNWTQRTTPAVPPARAMHAFAHDAHGGMLLFGGYSGAVSGLGPATFGDTWRFDGAHWQQRLVSGPAPRALAMIATDTARQRVVLFGGEDPNTWFGDTWEWDGTNWAQVATTGPAPRSRGAMVFHTGNGACLLHGGTDGTSVFGDSWLWNGASWVQLPISANDPPARSDHALAYDTVGNRVVLLGGQLGGGTAANDLWRWNGSWQQLAASTPVTPRFHHTFTYDAVRQRFVHHGGDPVLETWEWDGNANWTQYSNGATVGGVAASGAAWDPDRRRVLLWDGSAMWAFTAQPGITASFGNGCGAIVPQLLPEDRPFFGAPFVQEVVRAGTGSAVFLCGALAQGNTPLPGGCTVLLQNPQTLGLAIAGATGVAGFQMPVPTSVALKGVVFLTQAAVIAGNNLALTQGLRCTIGD